MPRVLAAEDTTGEAQTHLFQRQFGSSITPAKGIGRTCDDDYEPSF
jgi:hypothetical protein